MTAYATTLFADDVRFELQNKLTLVGIYGPEMIVFGVPPFTMPKLGIFVMFRSSPREIGEVKITITIPSETDTPQKIEHIIHSEPANEEVKRLSGEKNNVDDPDRLIGFELPIVISPLILTTPGKIQVRVQAGDEEIRAGSLKVRFDTPQGQSGPSE